ncbi:MAG: DNA-binding protein [Bacteroidales bacterium]|nr:DNA-binding protein [Bacteroidales bacterium]
MALVATETLNAFAISQYNDVMTIEKFAKHIASHGCVYSRADINAILYMAVDCMREMLLDGKKIRLGDLGDFSVSLNSRGAETADKFSAQNITAVNVIWEPGNEFKNLMNDAEFNLVASRKAQDAVIKAVKAGETVVDLNAEDKKPSDGDSQGGTSGGQTSGSGTQGGNTQGGTSGGSTGGSTPVPGGNGSDDNSLGE